MKSKAHTSISYSETEALRDIKQITNLWHILHNDTQKAFKELKRDKEDPEQVRYRERTFVRTFFAMVEGTCYGMRYLCLKAQAMPDTVKLDAATVQKLKADIDGKKWLKLVEAVPLSFSSLCTVVKWQFVLKTDDPGFDALKRAKKTRDQLMHPKNCFEVILTETHIADVGLALKWFATEMNRWRARPHQ